MSGFTLPSLRAAIATLALVFSATAVAAQDVDAELRVGVYTDVNETAIGAGLLTRLGRGAWMFNPNFEYVLVDRGDLATINADFHYDVLSENDVDIWLGAGPALVLRDGRGSDDTELGLNLLAGVGFLHHRPVRPFLQAKLLLSDEGSEGVFSFGLRFF